MIKIEFSKSALDTQDGFFGFQGWCKNYTGFDNWILMQVLLQDNFQDKIISKGMLYGKTSNDALTKFSALIEFSPHIDFFWLFFHNLYTLN